MNEFFEQTKKVSKRLNEETIKAEPRLLSRVSKRLSETGEYDRKPNDPEYFKKYQQENNWKVKCIRCDAMVARLRMCKHIKSKKCMAVAKERMAYQTAIILLEERNRDLDKQISELKKTLRNLQN